MRAVDIIVKKRNGKALSKEEINFLIQGYTQGIIPDYQLSAFAMTIYFQGMDEAEIAHLTSSMVQSGNQVDLSRIRGIKVDKHSTGGVGDKTTLVLIPLVAAASVPVAKMSGRGLGHTGGTLDKLESIPGFQINLDDDTFINQVNRVQCAVIGQTTNLAPADKKLYALRDVTGTVENIPLIASSIMSKKIAAGTDAIMLDVKVGSGAFMKDMASAEELARTMVAIGAHVGRETRALLTNMDQPLGCHIGNALEVKEAIQTLQGKGPEDLRDLCLTLGSHMLQMAGAKEDTRVLYDKLEKILAEGKALKKLAQMIEAQGGDARVIDEPDRILPQAQFMIPVMAEQEGCVHALNALEIGQCAMLLGAGRETKEAKIDLAVGIVLHKKMGDWVKRGEPLATLYANDQQKGQLVQERLLKAYHIAPEQTAGKPLILGLVDQEGTHMMS